MKKKAVLLIAAIAAMASLSACGKFECDLCGEEKTGKSWKVTMLGDSEEMTICDDCYQEVQALKDALN